MACAACGTPTSSRFCGHCGALAQPRTAITDVPVAKADAAGEDEFDRPVPDPEGMAAPKRTRGWWLAVPLVVVAVAVAVAQLRSEGPERITFGTGGVVGAGGTGVTSDRSVTDLEHRWSVDRPGTAAPERSWAARATVTPTHVLLHIGGDTVAVDPETLEEQWRTPELWVVPGAPIEDLLVIAGDELSRLDPTTGRLSDRVQLAEAVPYDQLAVTVGDTVVSSGPVRGFDRRTGEVRWSTDDSSLEAVHGSHGVVRQGGLHVVDLESGQRLWDVPTEPGWPTTVLDGLLVVADEQLTAYDLATGEVRWQVDDLPDGAQRGELRAQDGLVLSNWHHIPGRTGDRPPWTAVDAVGRSVALPAGATPRTGPLARVSGTWVHVTGGSVVAERDGQINWQRELDGVQQVAGAGNAVLVSDEDRGRLLDIETGEEVMSLPSERIPWVHTDAPVLLDGCLVSLELEGWTARLADGEPCWSSSWQIDPGAHRALPGEDAVVVQGDVLRALDADGDEQWTADLGRGHQPTPLTPRWMALVDGTRVGYDAGEVLVPLLDTRTGRTTAQLSVKGSVSGWLGHDDLAALHLSDHDGGDPRVELWELPTDDQPQARRRWTAPHPSGLLRLEDDRAVRVAGTTLTELDLDDGTVRRRVPLEVRTGPFMALHADVLVATTVNDHLVGLSRRDGSLLWEVPLTGRVYASPTIAGDLAYVAVRPRHVVVIDIHGGGIHDVVETSAHVSGSAFVAGKRLLVPTRGGLEAFGPELPQG